jgi:DNA-binding NarL/FixJ family response regulator
MHTRPTIRVLVIEDSITDAELISIYLEDVSTADYQVDTTDTLQRGLNAIRNTRFDVILVDLSLPDSFGIDTCRRVFEAAPDIAIIVLTGLDDEEKALDAMKAGAQDYLVKGQIDGSVLSRAIRYSIERQKAHEQQRQNNERMRLITEQLPAVLWTTDTALRINGPTADFLIIDDEHPPVAGTLLHEFFGTIDEKFAPIAAHRKAAAGESTSIDFRWKGRSLSIHVEPLRDGAGKIIGTIGISLDVSSHKRMQDELNAARHVQQALFPSKAPQISGYDIGGAVYAAEETAGDYFDFIPMSDDCLGLVVGDVTGHGLGPALLMAEMRAYLRALATTRPHASEILMLANRFLSADLEEHRFVTLFFARLDPIAGSLTYASAGHNAYLLKASGEVETLVSTGIPLGLIPDTIINTSFPVPFNTGDLLFIPTDGFQEAHTARNELYGLDRTLDFIASRRHQPASTIIEELRNEVCRFVGKPTLQDDMSAIIARRLSDDPNAVVEWSGAAI